MVEEKNVVEETSPAAAYAREFGWEGKERIEGEERV